MATWLQSPGAFTLRAFAFAAVKGALLSVGRFFCLAGHDLVWWYVGMITFSCSQMIPSAVAKWLPCEAILLLLYFHVLYPLTFAADHAPWGTWLVGQCRAIWHGSSSNRSTLWMSGRLSTTRLEAGWACLCGWQARERKRETEREGEGECVCIYARVFALHREWNASMSDSLSCVSVSVYAQSG